MEPSTLAVEVATHPIGVWSVEPAGQAMKAASTGERSFGAPHARWSFSHYPRAAFIE
jgi:hypothetical protein